MNHFIEKFGALVGERVETRPDAARRMLLAAYRLNGWASRRLPNRKTAQARWYIADVSTRSILRPFEEPDNCAVVSLFTPCELLQTFDVAPLFPEGLSCYIAAAASERGFIDFAEKAGVPETLCSYHKTLIGLAESGVLPKPRFIVNTTLACDANTLTFRRLASHYGVPHFTLDVPYAADRDAVGYLAQQLRDLRDFIGEATGREFSENHLKEAVARSARSLENYRRYLEMRASKYLRDEMTSEMYSVFALHVLLGTPQVEAYTEKLLANTRGAPARGKELRLLWAHTLPYWEDGLRRLLNFNKRCQVIACDMTFDALVPTDPEHPFESMARRIVQNTFNGSAMRRIEALCGAAKQLQVDGVVYFCHWGCKQTMGAAQLAKNTLESEGFPTLVLDGDGCDRSNMSAGQMMTRIQAFIEMLEGRA